MILNFAPLEYAIVIRLGRAVLEGNELRTPGEFVWHSVSTKIADLRVQSGPQRLAGTSLSLLPHHPVNRKEH